MGRFSLNVYVFIFASLYAVFLNLLLNLPKTDRNAIVTILLLWFGYATIGTYCGYKIAPSLWDLIVPILIAYLSSWLIYTTFDLCVNRGNSWIEAQLIIHLILLIPSGALFCLFYGVGTLVRLNR